jgi:hypothetical protein
VIREHIVRHESEYLAPLADRDLSIEGKSAGEFDAQLRARDGPPNNKCACGPDADDVQQLQLPDQCRRSESSVPTDVDAPQKNHECHVRCLLLNDVGTMAEDSSSAKKPRYSFGKNMVATLRSAAFSRSGGSLCPPAVTA